MNKDFVAIGVAQGDAFVVKRHDDFVALIDGGKSVAGFSTEFQRATNLDSVDVVVCTHNDADHANGIIGFLQSGLHCKEVWLPASWADRLNDLFDPARFTHELVDNLNGLRDAEIADIRDTDTFFKRLANGREANGIRDTEESVDAEELAERTREEDGGDYIELSRYPLLYWHPDWWFRRMRALRNDDPRFRLLIEAIAAGERIKQIAQLAFHRGCRIRWFEYSDPNPSGGIPGKLVPVNAREVHEVKVSKSSALMYLALTITNKQSLVLCSPQDGGAPAVLFTADSDLAFPNTVPWSDGMIITAPHHGSEANAAAYQRFQREMLNPVSTAWVRSDGRFKSRPGRWFLDLRGTNVPVFCTFCRGASRPKQDLVFTASGQSWNPVNTQSCSCR
ncbi:MAG: MBL fold metallo-hydrolase [Acidobacteriota bacterium]